MNDSEKMQNYEARLAKLERQRSRRRWSLVLAIILTPVGIWAATALPHTFKDGDTLGASQLNANFAALADAAAPVGTIVAFAGSTAPSGWLLCDGTQVSRSSYAALYAVIANAYGSGDGTTSFHLPDLRGRFLRGVDGSAGVDPDKASRTAMNTGGNAGNLVGSVQADAIRTHTHIIPDNEFGGDGGTTFDLGNPGAATYGNRTTTGTLGNETRPVNAYVNFIIKH